MATKTVDHIEEHIREDADPWWTVHWSDGKKNNLMSGQKEIRNALIAGTTYEVAMRQNGKYWDIVTVKPVGANGTKVESNEPSVPPEVWEAKDRSTYMESAYKSASQAFQGRGETKEARHDLIVLARWIYAEIMLAHDDKPLPAVRE